MTENNETEQVTGDFVFLGDIEELTVDLGTDGESSAPGPESPEWRLGQIDEPEPEISRVGRVAIGTWIEEYTTELYGHGRRILTEAHDGEDITVDDVDQIRREIRALEHVLDEFAEPVAEECSREEGTDD